jgi:hypothetical protein
MPHASDAMLTLVLDGGDERALQVLRALPVGVEATSLPDHRSCTRHTAPSVKDAAASRDDDAVT